MIGNVSRIVLIVLTLVAGAALEDLLPKLLGVGFPVLLSAVQSFAPRFGFREVVVLALAAGSAEEAISSLDPMTCSSFFLLAAMLARYCGSPRLVMLLTYPCLQVWLSVWTVGVGGGVFGRILVSFPLGMATALAVGAAVEWLIRKAAVDERS